MTDAELAHEILLHSLRTLRVQARVHAAEGDDLASAGRLSVAALEVAMAALLEAAEYLPAGRQKEFLPALEQLRAEVQHLLLQIHKLENP